jgi:phage tail-like protein
MAIVREHPYGSTRFVVTVDGEPLTGFLRVYLPELVTDVVEHRDGKDRSTIVRQLPGRPRIGPLVLQRGFAGDLTLQRWWRAVADGDRNVFRTVEVTLLDEAGQGPVAQWRLRHAWPTKWTVSPLDARASEIVVETVELVTERLEIE